MGYHNVQIYNGGIKDWKKNGYPLHTIEPLPVYDGRFISAAELLTAIVQAENNECVDAKKDPVLTILDLRTENILKGGKRPPAIRTNCLRIQCLLDDLIGEDLRRKIPRDSRVVVVTETGNRDKFAMRFLYSKGYNNLVGLRFGMRGWIKEGYPIDYPDKQEAK